MKMQSGKSSGSSSSLESYVYYEKVKVKGNTMSWKDKIPGTFGSKDKLFAGQYNDCSRASKMLAQANSEKVSYEEYLKEIQNWLEAEGCTSDHVTAEMKKVRELNSYFNY